MTLEEGSYQWFRKKGEGDYNGKTDDLKTSGQVLLDFIAQAAKKYHTPNRTRCSWQGSARARSCPTKWRCVTPEAVGGELRR